MQGLAFAYPGFNGETDTKMTSSNFTIEIRRRDKIDRSYKENGQCRTLLIEVAGSSALLGDRETVVSIFLLALSLRLPTRYIT
jgi:hypothetical protein